MTANQLAYWANEERKRANRVNESETFRSNFARESETARSNLAREKENVRHNTATEGLSFMANTETKRSNQARESETAFHNRNTELQAARNLRADMLDKQTKNLLTEQAQLYGEKDSLRRQQTGLIGSLGNLLSKALPIPAK